MELKKCSKKGCDVQAQKMGCCDYIVKCNKCSNKIEHPVSIVAIQEIWENYLKDQGKNNDN